MHRNIEDWKRNWAVWVVTHIPTGVRTPVNSHVRELAVRRAVALESIPLVDWSVSTEELINVQLESAGVRDNCYDAARVE